MNRSRHLFQFNGKQIGSAANMEAHYHYDRVDFWVSEQGRAKEEAEKSGLQIREYEVTGGKNVEMVIDPTLQKRLNECASKVANHQIAAARYRLEAQAYLTQPDRMFELDPDDVFYFRICGGERPE